MWESKPKPNEDRIETETHTELEQNRIEFSTNQNETLTTYIKRQIYIKLDVIVRNLHDIS